MKTSNMKPTKPVGDAPLPEGARHTPGSKAWRSVQKAPHAGEIQIGKGFVSDPRGGPELKIGAKHIRVEGDKPREQR
jgi:hypothetical protein